MNETVPEPMPFEYSAQYIENISYSRYNTKYGTTSCFFQDHHTLHSYNWYNDNRSIQHMYIKILHIRHHWDIVHMSTS